MAVCSGGSEPKPDSPAAIVVTNQFLQGLLPPVLQWLYPFLPYVNQFAVGDVASFCASPPPDMIAPAADAFLSLITGGKVGLGLDAANFVNSVYQNYLWNSLCQCSSGGTYTPNPNPTQPTGLPAVNPTNVVSPVTGVPCWTQDRPLITMVPTAQWFEIIGTNEGVVSSLDFAHSIALPAGATQYRVSLVMPPVSDPYVPFADFHLYFLNSSNTFVAGYDHNGMHKNQTDIHVGTIPSTASRVYFGALAGTNDAGLPTYNFSAKLEVFCGGGVETPLTACCPPDTIAAGILDQILNAVTLIQRQVAPFAWIVGETHSGLTGAGEIDLQGAIGARITCSLPGRVGVSYGDPDTFYDVGHIRWGNADAFQARQLIDTSPMLSFPQAAGAQTKLGYTLLPGVTATIEVLRREY